MENMELYEKCRAVPNDAKKEIKGGRMSGMTNINAMWRLKMLTEMFGPCGVGWYYKTTNRWMETSGDEIAAFVEIELHIKVDGEWSMPIFGTGGSKFAAKEKSGIYVSDECYKMATTDALSVACKQIGMGADVYWSEDRSKYTDQSLASKEQIVDMAYLAGALDVNLPALYQKYGVDANTITDVIAKKIFESLQREKRKREADCTH
jgi:hypothetical protein